jgi:hypothetical protein
LHRIALPVAVAVVALACAVGAAEAASTPLNLYEWSGPAPIVVAAESNGYDGKHVEVSIDRVFRGDLAPGGIVRVDVRRANRERSEHTEVDPVRLGEGEAYLLLLRPGRRAARDRTPIYELVRGALGARPLPAEGRAGVLELVADLVAIQELHDHDRIWERMSQLLDEDQPMLVEIALQQFVKFRQGGPRQLEPARRLLAHADPEIRRLATELLGQLADRHGAEVADSGPFLREELAGRARRDPEPAVRIAAATALDALEGPGVDEVLAEMAAEDPDQDVRYVAETLIYDRRTRRRPAQDRPN